jgi:rhodanese-related sulfurtransferase
MKYSFVHDNRFVVELDSSNIDDLKSYKEELLVYVNSIYNRNNITLLFNGDQNSKLLANILLELNIPFTCLIGSFKRDNSDCRLEKQFCILNNIDYEIVFISRRTILNQINYYAHRGVIYQLLTSYYIHYLIDHKSKTGYVGLFLSGFNSDYKIENKKIYLRPDPFLLSERTSFVNVFTNRLLLSRCREENYGRTLKDSDKEIRESFNKNVLPTLKQLNSNIFISEDFELDLDNIKQNKKLNYYFVNTNRCDIDIDFSVENNLKSFKQEVLDHFYTLCKGKDVFVIFSGGNDSRFVARSLIELGIKFNAGTYVHAADYSDYNNEVSTSFCKEWKIPHEPIYLEETKFYAQVLDWSLNKNIVYVICNSYYMHWLMDRQRQNGFNGVFLSGAGSEFKLINGKIPIPHNNEFIKFHNPDWYNFTTSRTLLSYVRNPIFLEEYKNTKMNGFDVRDRIYKDAYPDTEFVEKTRGGDLHIEDWLTRNQKLVSFTNKERFIINGYEFKFEEYLKDRNLI